MMKSILAVCAMLLGLGVAACKAERTQTEGQASATLSVAPATMARVGAIEDRFLSYNVEMLEVTGGRFWKPYKDIAKTAGQTGSEAKGGDTPAGMSADLYQYRPPIDLTNRRLRAMAGALGPAYVRISGTWANTTYFADTDTPPKDPPKGYGGVLTRQQWLGTIAFSRAVDAPIVTSMPNGVGTRGADQVWRSDQARRWLAFTKAHGGTIAAAEYFNEPTMASMGGAPKGYDAAAFGRDFRIFDAFMRKEYPDTKLLAPGSVGEANADWSIANGGYGDLRSAALRGEQEFGGIDILFANAGIQSFHPLLELEDAGWPITIDVNLTGTANAVRAFAPVYCETRRRTSHLDYNSEHASLNGRRGSRGCSVPASP